ncbi:MAG: SEC-C domain-containing protein [Myxococcales bacterium]|nr:SEC-C domain-containing protein [Myxococcales bacterium]
MPSGKSRNHPCTCGSGRKYKVLRRARSTGRAGALGLAAFAHHRPKRFGWPARAPGELPSRFELGTCDPSGCHGVQRHNDILPGARPTGSATRVPGS